MYVRIYSIVPSCSLVHKQIKTLLLFTALKNPMGLAEASYALVKDNGIVFVRSDPVTELARHTTGTGNN